jgi:hypothetical protein
MVSPMLRTGHKIKLIKTPKRITAPIPWAVYDLRDQNARSDWGKG